MIFKHKYLISAIFFLLCFFVFSVSVNAKASKYGGVAVFSFLNRIDSLDPTVSDNLNSLQIYSGIFEGLVKFNPETSKIEPSLARKWITSDYKVWTFFLQKNIKFHDGTDFTSEAVKFNFEHILLNSKKNYTSNYRFYKNIFGNNGEYIKSIDTPERYKIRITLAYPDVLFLYKLAMPELSIQSPVALKKVLIGDTYKPVGTGPFYFSEWRRSGRIILNKNINYNDTVYLDRVIFEPYSDVDYCIRQMLRGVTDISSSGMSKKDFEKKNLETNFSFLNSPSDSLFFLLLNPERKEFENSSARRAVSYLIDKKDLAKEYNGVEAYSFLTPSMFGYTKKNFSYNTDDITSFLSSIESDRVFTLIYPEDNFFDLKSVENLAIKIQKYLRAGGVKVILKKLSYDEYISALLNKSYDIAFWGERDIYGSPDIYLPLIYSVRVFKKMTGKSSEWTYEFDSLIKKVRSEVNPNKRKNVYLSIDNLLSDNMPSIPLFYKNNTVVYSDRVNNLVYTPSGTIILRNIWVTN